MILLEMMEHKVPYDGSNDFIAAIRATSGQRLALEDNMPGYMPGCLIEACWVHNPTACASSLLGYCDSNGNQIISSSIL